LDTEEAGVKMPVMAVNNENQHEQAGDCRSRPRWSASKKMDAVLRLLRGEPLDVLSRELGVEAHRLAAWRDDFLEGGKEALKGQRPDRSPDDRALRQAERKIGQLTMENEILRSAALHPGAAPLPRHRPATAGRRRRDRQPRPGSREAGSVPARSGRDGRPGGIRPVTRTHFQHRMGIHRLGGEPPAPGGVA
jgi:transposase